MPYDEPTFTNRSGTPLSAANVNNLAHAAAAGYRHVDVKHPDYGAEGDGVTDDTAAIQAALDACPDGGTVFIPIGVYKTTAALSITKSLTLEGGGIAGRVGAAAASGNGSGPLTSPYLTGSVLLPSMAGQNGVTISATGVQPNLRNFGIRFADAIRFRDTGYGVDCISPDIVTLGHDISAYSPRWDNLIVWGHDGDHYGYHIVNSLMGTFAHLRSYGGGGIHMVGDGDVIKCGNATIIHPYAWLFLGGSANSYTFEARTAQYLNLIEVLRPQTLITSCPAEFVDVPAGITNPSAAQYLWKHTGGPDLISIYDPDLEGYEYDNPVDFGGQGANVLMRPGGVISKAITGYEVANQRLPIDYDAEQVTLTPGLGAGVGGTATKPFGANETGGLIRIATDGSPGAQGSLICSVAFSRTAYRSAVFFQSANTTAAALITFFPYGLSQSGFDVYATAQLAPNTTYDFFYIAQKSYA